MATVTVKQDDIEPPHDVIVVDRTGKAWRYDKTLIEVNGRDALRVNGWLYLDFMDPMHWDGVRELYGDNFPMSYVDVVDPFVADDEFIVKDSGAREEYTNGFVRDSEESKHDFTRLLSIEGLEFVPVELVERMAAHMSKGAVKYGKENWRQARGAIAKARFLRSACRHFLQWVRGDRDEDHGMAVCFNIIAYELTEENDE